MAIDWEISANFFSICPTYNFPHEPFDWSEIRGAESIELKVKQIHNFFFDINRHYKSEKEFLDSQINNHILCAVFCERKYNKSW